MAIESQSVLRTFLQNGGLVVTSRRKRSEGEGARYIWYETLVFPDAEEFCLFTKMWINESMEDAIVRHNSTVDFLSRGKRNPINAETK